MANTESKPREELKPKSGHDAEIIFEQLSAGSLLLWGYILVEWSGMLHISVSREDIIELAQTTSAMAGITLAALAVLQRRQKPLKLFFGALTTVFVLATIVAWITAMVTTNQEPQPAELHFGGIIGFIYMTAGILCIRRQLVFALLRQKPELKYKASLNSRVAIFILPFALVGIWPFNGTPFGPGIALALGGMIYLLAATTFLTLDLI